MVTRRKSGTTKRATNRKVVRKPKKRKGTKPRAPRGPLDVEAQQLRRMRQVSMLLSVWLLAVGANCIYLQGCESEAYLKEAERNYLRKMRMSTQRGDIYDRNGEALAASVDADTVYANPRTIENPVKVAEALGEVLDIKPEKLMRILTADAHFRYVKRQISDLESQRVRQLDFEGIEIQMEPKRYYPKKELAGQLLGFVGFDSAGQEGLEATYDDLLRGNRLEARYHRDARGHYAMVDALPDVHEHSGRSLQLTLDEKIQEVAERELERAFVASEARSGIAVVMDVRTGDILALAQVPRVNPNQYREQIAQDEVKRKQARERPGTPMPIARQRNRAIADQFEPGSTFKIFTLAAALEEGLIGLHDTLDLEGGRLKVGRKWISDTHRFKEPQSIRDVLKHSSNVGFIKIGRMLGRQRLHEYLVDFGFGVPTGVNLLGDIPGLLRAPKTWADITLANISFGQGVAVTALQLVSATAAIGNRGVLMQPRIVKAELDASGDVVRAFPPQRRGRVVSGATARQVIDAMQGVVEFDGTGSAGWIYDYEVAGKTGTAQKPDTIAGGYAEDGWIASFVGLAPARRPRLAVLVAIDEPRGQYYGGVVAAPAHKAITEWTLNYLGEAPSYGSRERVRRRPLVNHFGKPHIAAEGAYYDWPADKQPGVDLEAPREVKVPDFAGLPVRHAVRRAHETFLTVEIDGTGTVTGQSLTAGVDVAPWTKVTLYLERPDTGPVAAPRKEDERR